MSLSNTTTSTTTQNPVQPSIKDERGNIILISDQLGVGIKVICAGETTDKLGKTVKWSDNVKIVAGENVIKLTAIQADYIRLAFNQPEVVAELAKRKTAELNKLMKELQG